jgi:methionyl-tRNA formyltransferase
MSGLRVVVLAGPSLQHRHTCATLIDRGVDVVGMLVADERQWGLPMGHLKRVIRKEGVVAAGSQSMARVLYLLENRGKDRAAETRIFDPDWVDETLGRAAVPTVQVRSYTEPAALELIRQAEPDLFVAHTPFWVGKTVRELARSGKAIGGHPGWVPEYRGSHSALWAILRGEPDAVGCSVFELAAVADGGPLLARERIVPQRGDSFVVLGWRGMCRTAALQAELVAKATTIDDLQGEPIDIPEDSYFGNPGVADYLRYRRRARALGLR